MAAECLDRGEHLEAEKAEELNPGNGKLTLGETMFTLHARAETLHGGWQHGRTDPS